jgi:tetratricopeptide (TPR) repeat protein
MAPGSASNAAFCALLLVAGLMLGQAPVAADVSAAELATASDLVAAEKFDAARAALLQLAERHPGAAEVQAELGKIEFELRAYLSAVKHFERATALAPAVAEYQFLVGRALTGRITQAGLFKKPGIAKRMRNAFEEAIRLDPGHARARLALVSFLTNAPNIVGGSKKKARAEAGLLKTIDLASYHRALARIALANKQRSEALAHYRVSLRVRFEGRTAGEFAAQLENEEKWDEALAVLEQALGPQGDGTAPLFLYFFYGRAAAASGRQLEAGGRAIDRFIAADRRRKSEETQAESHYVKGRIHERLDQIEAARSAYARALGVDKGHKAAGQALKRLGGGKGRD